MIVFCMIIVFNAWHGVVRAVTGSSSKQIKELEPVSNRLRTLYNHMSETNFKKLNDEKIRKKAAEFFISRKFFSFNENTSMWEPLRIDYGMDYGIAIRLDSAADQFKKLNSEIRKLVPPEAMYLSPRGHHITIQHLFNQETMIKKNLSEGYNSLIHNVFLPSISDVILNTDTDRIFIEMTHMVLSTDDGSLILLGKITPDGVIHRLRKKMWSSFLNLKVLGVRDRPWDVIHITIGRLLPSSPSEGVGLRITESQLSNVYSFIESYNSRKPVDRIQSAVSLTDAVRYLHNRAMFSIDTYHSLPLSSFKDHFFIKNVNLTFGGFLK